jgi:hypothetical protein
MLDAKHSQVYAGLSLTSSSCHLIRSATAWGGDVGSFREVEAGN